jgi:hypothetical protein
MRSALKKLLTIVFAGLLAAPLLATTVQKMELPQLVSASDNIVQGRVESVEAKYVDRTVFTYISVAVDDPIKGDRRRTVLVRQLGGRIGAKTVWISGMPQYKPGDEVILFLKDKQDGTYDVIGLNQGKYDIVQDYAVSRVWGVTVVDAKTGKMSDGGFVSKAPVDAFKAKIREMMR